MPIRNSELQLRTNTALIGLVGLGFIVAVASVAPLAVADAQSVEQYWCDVQIGHSSFSRGHCTQSQQGELLRINWPHAAPTKNYTIEINNDGEGAWNGLAAGGTVDQPLGKLSKVDDCWIGDNVRICVVSQTATSEVPQAEPQEGGESQDGSSFRGIQLGMTEDQVQSSLPEGFAITREHPKDDLELEHAFAEVLARAGIPQKRDSVFIVKDGKTCGEIRITGAGADRLRFHQCFFDIPAGMQIQEFADQIVQQYGLEDGMSGNWEMRRTGTIRPPRRYFEYVGIKQSTHERFTASLDELNNVLKLTVESVPIANFN